MFESYYKSVMVSNKLYSLFKEYEQLRSVKKIYIPDNSRYRNKRNINHKCSERKCIYCFLIYVK